MMRLSKIKFVLLLGFLMPTYFCGAYGFNNNDNNSIVIKVGHTQSSPKDSSIQASIDGHTLTVVFTENLGQVNIEVSSVSGGEIQVESTPTPNGVIFYIADTGSYIVTFFLPNGDEYYGEFEVTD